MRCIFFILLFCIELMPAWKLVHFSAWLSTFEHNICILFKGILHPKMKMLSLITKPCRSKPVKALFVFRTQFKILWMKTRRLVTVPLTALYITLSRSRKVWKASSEYSICHQWFNLNLMKQREHLFCAKKTKQRFYSIICLLCFSVAPFWRISTAYALVCQQRATRIHLLRLFTLWIEWKHCLRPADIL